MEISENNALLVLFDLLLLFRIYLLLHNVMKGEDVSKRKMVEAVLLFLIFSVCPFWGTDWFHYKELIEGLSVTSDSSKSHLEIVYLDLLPIIDYNYWVFRLLIWGGALVLFVDTVKRLSVRTDLVYYIFGCGFLCWFSYARVSLSMALAFYGASLLFRPYESIGRLSYILGFASILVSFYFHKSASFVIVVVLGAYLMMFLNRGYIKILLLMLPLFVFLTNIFVGDLFSNMYDSEDDSINQIVQSSQNYMGNKASVSGIGAALLSIFERTPYYVSAFVCYQIHNSKVYFEMPKEVRYYAKVLFLIVYLSSLFLFDYEVNTSSMYGRFLRFAFIPTSIVLAYFYENGIYAKYTRFAISVAMFSSLYAVSYSFYIRLVS